MLQSHSAISLTIVSVTDYASSLIIKSCGKVNVTIFNKMHRSAVLNPWFQSTRDVCDSPSSVL